MERDDTLVLSTDAGGPRHFLAGWRSKDTLKDHLASLVKELGATIYPVPRSDCVEVIRDDMRILVAIKESRKQKMWVDARLFTDRWLEQTYKGGYILLIDHWAQRLLVLPFPEVLVPILVRAGRGRAFHPSFHVDRVSSGSGYEVRVLPGTTGISVEHINTLEPVLAALRPESSPPPPSQPGHPRAAPGPGDRR